MTFVLGLTGSIGMGKSTTAAMFADEGVPVWDADATVHTIYSTKNPVTDAIADLVEGSVTEGVVDRAALKQAIAETPSLLRRIESLVAPAVAASRDAFIADAIQPVVLIDHPLLLESGADVFCDAIVVVSVDADTQRQRVLDRGTMDENTLDIILGKQMSDAEKRSRADYVIETTTLDAAREQVQDVLEQIRKQINA